MKFLHMATEGPSYSRHCLAALYVYGTEKTRFDSLGYYCLLPAAF